MDPLGLLRDNTPVDQFSAQYNTNPQGLITPEQAAAMRKYSQSLLDNSIKPVPGTKGGWTVGLQHMVDALVGGNQAYRANQGQLAGKDYAAGTLPTRVDPFATSNINLVEGSAPSDTLPAGAAKSFEKEGDVIGKMESGGRYDNVTTTTNPRTGQRQSALGKYGVMDFNVGPWSKEVLGKELTPQQFLASKEAQDAIARTKLAEYTAKYGPEGAGRAWLGGPGGVNNPQRADALGTTVGDYGRRYAQALGFNGQPAPVGDNAQGAIVNALAAGGAKGPVNPPGVPAGSPQQMHIAPFAVPQRPQITEEQFRRSQGGAGSWLSPEQQKLSSDAYYNQFQPLSVPYMGGNVIVNPRDPRQQFWSPGVKMDAKSSAQGVEAPTPFMVNPDGTITYLGEKPQQPGKTGGAVPSGASPASAPAPLLPHDPITAAQPPASTPAATPAPVTPPVTPPAEPAAAPVPPPQGNLPLGIRGEVAPTNQVASNVPMATAGAPVAPGPAETGAAAIEKAQGALPPTALGVPPPADAGPMGAKVAQALATQPPIPPKGAETAEIPSKLQELGDFGIDLEHRKKLADQDAEKYSKNLDDYSRIGQIATKSLPPLKIAQQMVKDPRFYSGVLADPYIWLQKGRSALNQFLGVDPNGRTAAAPMEVFEKILSGNIVNDLKVLLGGLGQIRLAEIDLITKSVANRYNTPAANAAVLGMMAREHSQAANIGNIVANYDKGWVLDDKDQWVRRTTASSNADLNTNINNYIQRHPLFTDKEIADINNTLDLAKAVPNEKVTPQKVNELREAAKVPGVVEPAAAAEAPKTSAPAEAPAKTPANNDPFGIR